MSSGGGTESSKLNSGMVVVVVGATVLRAAPAEPGFVVGALVVAEPPLHALMTRIPATRTPVARFPTRMTVGSRVPIATIGDFATKWPKCPIVRMIRR